MSKITEKELNKLESAKTKKDWNDTCDEIQKNHGGFPSDWYGKVLSGALKTDLDLSLHVESIKIV